MSAVDASIGGTGGGMGGSLEMRGTTGGSSGAGGDSTASTSPSMSATAGVSGGMAGPPPCSESGAMRCVAEGKGKREQCTGGVWTEGVACAQGEVCAGMDTTTPGACLLVAAVCAGHKGKAVCDGEGTLYHCDANEVIEHRESCGSAELCQPGIESQKCAKCAPGKYRCTGKQLEKCDERGEAFAADTPCATAELCDAAAGKCKAPVCDTDQWVCKGDDLYRCNQQQTELARQMSCGPGLCNERMQTCVACASDSQCPDRASGCQEASCKGNVCGTTPARDGKACGGASICRSGACCTPDCRNKCGGAADGCGGVCNAVCPPRCGNGVVEGDEICDGNCPKSCPDDGNACTREVPRGAPCMIQCKTEVIGTGTANTCGGCGALRASGANVAVGLPLGTYCQVGQGGCFATGKIDCESRPSDVIVCTARGASATSETCNGVDDDCDGIADNNGADASCGAGQRCASGAGYCEPI